MTQDELRRVRVIGAGRAGGAFALALRAAGWHVDGPFGRDHDLASDPPATLDLLAVPDRQIAAVAASLRPRTHVVIAHVSGASGLDLLERHPRRAAIHPLVSLPDAAIGAARLVGAWFAVAGDAIVDRVVDDLGGHRLVVADEDRAVYHAAACVAANHLVALLGQVERLGRGVGVPLEAYLALARGAVENVAEVGPAAALTGPVARGDWLTVARHLQALPPSEREAYAVLAGEAHRLARPDLADPLGDLRARVSDLLP